MNSTLNRRGISRLSPEQQHELRQRFLLTGEAANELGVAFDAPTPAVRRALQRHPDANVLRDSLVALRLTPDQLSAAVEECLSDPAKAVEWYEKGKSPANPVAMFLEECSDADPQGEVAKDTLFDAWSGWIAGRPLVRPLTRSLFFERIKGNAPHAISDCYEKGGHKFNVWRGLTLKGVCPARATTR